MELGSPPIQAVTALRQALPAEALEERPAHLKVEDDPRGEETFLDEPAPLIQVDPGLNPLWSRPHPPEPPESAAGAYGLARVGWSRRQEGQTLDVLV